MFELCCVRFVFLVSFYVFVFFFFSSRRRHTRWTGDWSSDVCSSDLRRADLAGEVGTPIRIEVTEADGTTYCDIATPAERSEERRVGKECRSRWSPYH